MSAYEELGQVIRRIVRESVAPAALIRFAVTGTGPLRLEDETSGTVLSAEDPDVYVWGSADDLSVGDTVYVARDTDGDYVVLVGGSGGGGGPFDPSEYSLSDFAPPEAHIDFGGFRAENLAEGVDGDDAATLLQLAVIAGALSAVEADLASLETIVTLLDGEVAGIGADLATLDAAVVVLQGNVSSLMSDVANLLSAIENKQDAHAKLTALSGLTGGANQLPYFSGTNSMAQTALTAFARSLLGAADAAAARGTLGAAASSDLAAKQDAHAKLAALAGLSGGANNLPYFTGTNTMAQTVLSSFARTLLDDASASAARGTLGLGSLAVLSSINNANWSGEDLAVVNGGTGASDAASARANLGAAPLASPAFTGTPTAPTPSSADNSTRIATTEFVQALISGGGMARGTALVPTSGLNAAGTNVVHGLGVTPAQVLVTPRGGFAGSRVDSRNSTFFSVTLFHRESGQTFGGNIEVDWVAYA